MGDCKEHGKDVVKMMVCTHIADGTAKSFFISESNIVLCMDCYDKYFDVEPSTIDEEAFATLCIDCLLNNIRELLLLNESQ